MKLHRAFDRRLLHFVFDTESGSHVQLKWIKQDKIKALKIEPAQGIGILAVDGEVEPHIFPIQKRLLHHSNNFIE